jgi:MFS superfamily sulfate permease-like transporter
VVALKGMLMKVTEFLKFWRLDKTDAAIWAVTFVIVIFFDVEYGLLVGVLLCIGRLLVLAVRPYTCKLALAPGTELYLDAKRYKGVWRAYILSCFSTLVLSHFCSFFVSCNYDAIFLFAGLFLREMR